MVFAVKSYLILLATNFWCTARPTITAASTTKNVFPFSFVNITLLLKVYVNKNKNENRSKQLCILYNNIIQTYISI